MVYGLKEKHAKAVFFPEGAEAFSPALVQRLVKTLTVGVDIDLIWLGAIKGFPTQKRRPAEVLCTHQDDGHTYELRW